MYTARSREKSPRADGKGEQNGDDQWIYLGRYGKEETREGRSFGAVIPYKFLLSCLSRTRNTSKSSTSVCPSRLCIMLNRTLQSTLHSTQYPLTRSYPIRSEHTREDRHRNAGVRNSVFAWGLGKSGSAQSFWGSMHVESFDDFRHKY